MLPTGRAITLWRFEKGLTQAGLAQRSGVPRPNLSLIEQGARDVTVSTVRRLADALGIRAGILVDGIPPSDYPTRRWTREELDRIARGLAGLPVRLSADEKKAAAMIRSLFEKTRRGVRQQKQSFLAAKLIFGPVLFQNLLGRIEKHHQVTP